MKRKLLTWLDAGRHFQFPEKCSAGRVSWSSLSLGLSLFSLRASCAIVLMASLYTAARAETGSYSLWKWNNIVLRLETLGEERTFTFEQLPKAEQARMGVVPGAIFWEGTRLGNQLRGRAHLYRAGCEPVDFDLNGDARLDATGQLTLTTTAPLNNGNACDIPKNETSKITTFVFKLLGAKKTVEDE